MSVEISQKDEDYAEGVLDLHNILDVFYSTLNQETETGGDFDNVTYNCWMIHGSMGYDLKQKYGTKFVEKIITDAYMERPDMEN